jgi:hypothetical protein
VASGSVRDMAKFTPREGWVFQAYRFALDPTSGQEQMLRSHAGAHRFAWNLGLAWCRQRYAAERKWYSAAELHRMWNAAKKADPERFVPVFDWGDALFRGGGYVAAAGHDPHPRADAQAGAAAGEWDRPCVVGYSVAHSRAVVCVVPG